MRRLKLVAALLVFVGGATPSSADEPSLAVSQSGVTRRFTSSELLARSDTATLALANDASYGGPGAYVAVPLLALLSELPGDSRSDTLESRAADGFVAQIPLSVVR